MKTTILIVFAALISSFAVAQNCGDFLVNARNGIKYPWKFDNQSRSGLFVAGKTSQINIVCQEGKDYKISFSTSSNILKELIFTITDESGNEYYSYGSNKAAKDVAAKKEFLLSLEKQKLTIKGSKSKIKISGDIDNLKLEIQKMETEAMNAQYAPKMFYEFTPAENMNLTVTITLKPTTYKGCVAMIVSNRISEKLGF